MVWKKLSATDVTLSKRWYLEAGQSAVQIAKRLGRSPSTSSRLVIKRRPLKVQGRKPLLSKGKVDRLVAKTGAMIHENDSELEVNVSMNQGRITLQSGDSHHPVEVGFALSRSSQYPHSALTVPSQCPRSAHTVPTQCPHSAHTVPTWKNQ